MSKVKVRYRNGAIGPDGTVINPGDEISVDADTAKRLLESETVEPVAQKASSRAEKRSPAKKR